MSTAHPSPPPEKPRPRRTLRCGPFRRSISPRMEPIERVERIGWDRDPTTGCWEWRGEIESPHGRARVVLREGRSTPQQVVYDAVYGPRPDGVHVRQSCGNLACLNPDHLKPSLDSGRTGRPSALSAHDCAVIQTRHRDDKVSRADLAAEYHVSQSTIGRVVRNG